MKIQLIRNLNTKRNKDQEDFFENSLNYELFFASEKVLEKIDSWSFYNIKKLVTKIPKDRDIKIEFDHWNNSVNYIFRNLHLKIENLNIDNEIKNILESKNVKNIHAWLLNNESKEKRVQFLIAITEYINEPKFFELLNSSLNSNLLKINSVIDMLMPEFLSKIIINE